MREKYSEKVEKVINAFVYSISYIVAIMMIIFLEVLCVAEMFDGMFNIPKLALLAMLVTCNVANGKIMHMMIDDIKEMLRG